MHPCRGPHCYRRSCLQPGFSPGPSACQGCSNGLFSGVFLRALEAVVNTQHFLQEINHVSDSKTKSQFRSFLFRVSVPVLHIPSPEGFTNTTLIFPTCTCRQTSSVSHPQSCTRALKATRRAFQKVKSGSACNLPYSPAKCFQ